MDSESLANTSKNTESRKKKKNISKSAGKGNIQAMLSNMPEKKKEVNTTLYIHRCTNM